jgi:hypothetical protein
MAVTGDDTADLQRIHDRQEAENIQVVCLRLLERRLVRAMPSLQEAYQPVAFRAEKLKKIPDVFAINEHTHKPIEDRFLI